MQNYKISDYFHKVHRADSIAIYEALASELEELATTDLVSMKDVEIDDTEEVDDEGAAAAEAILEVNKYFANYCFRSLFDKSEESNRVLAYLESRGIDKATVLKHGIGYCHGSFLPTSLEYNKFSFLEAKITPAFLRRIIVPILDERGLPVGFTARKLPWDTNIDSPKYYNTPETKLFSKRNILFNLDKTAPGSYVFLTEGVFDAIMMGKGDPTNGVKGNNAVGVLGAGLTIEHIALLKKYNLTPILAYDNDEAGRKATKRAYKMLRSYYSEIFCLDYRNVPDGIKDPADAVRAGIDIGIYLDRELASWFLEDLKEERLDAAAKYRKIAETLKNMMEGDNRVSVEQMRSYPLENILEYFGVAYKKVGGKLWFSTRKEKEASSVIYPDNSWFDYGTEEGTDSISLFGRLAGLDYKSAFKAFRDRFF